MRFATKPGRLPTAAGRFPIFCRNRITLSTTSGPVVAAGMTSTPGVHSGGLNQCIPRNRSGRSTASASSSIGNEEVLETMTASGGAAPEQAARISCLRSSFSGTASKTSSASLDAAGASSAVSTASARPAASAESKPASACPLARSTSRSFASRVSSGVASVSRTPMPAAAKHSATPRPIVPAPITAATRGHPSYVPRLSKATPLPVLHRFTKNFRQVLLRYLSRRPHEQPLLLHRSFHEVVYVSFVVAELMHPARGAHVLHEPDEDLRQRVLVGLLYLAAGEQLGDPPVPFRI